MIALLPHQRLIKLQHDEHSGMHYALPTAKQADNKCCIGHFMQIWSPKTDMIWHSKRYI